MAGNLVSYFKNIYSRIFSRRRIVPAEVIKPRIAAHRGASGHRPENTMAAFDKGIDLGAEMIELDIQMSKDGKLAVIHDTTLERTSNGRGRVKDHTWEQLSSLDAGSWMAGQYKKERIQSLEAVLDKYLGKAGFLIELKKPSLYPGIEKKLAEVIQSRVSKAETSITVLSFDTKSLKTFHELCPEIPIGVLIRRFPPGLRHRNLINLSKYASYICPKVTLINASAVRKIKAYNLGIMIWPVNDRRTAEKVKGLPIDIIITDYPDLFLNI
ncbi:glycerophosphodiester phosphodiesterase [Peribacillus kribbensis]|uniref:glycerophosphodiester phosphodiesterase n=1 Tax=Peribacillus kribbensis TaxID=356658 RepID=UPI000688F521|nr:glycerophosphodiester phosphodiesterase family protein [Peribacillus kribbensis]